MPWPKGKPRPNNIAKMNAARKPRPKICPEKGTEAWRRFRKWQAILGTAAAHAELRRGANG